MGHNPIGVSMGALLDGTVDWSPSSSAQALVNTMWALARLGHNPTGTDERIPRYGSVGAANINVEVLVNCLWALQTLGHNPI